MGHGFMGVQTRGALYLGGFIALFAYLHQSFKGPDRPKFLVDPDIVETVKETQPGLVPEYYYNKKKN